MKTERFKILVEALEALPEDVKNNIVIMGSMYEPTCGTPGCFAGLISIVANDIPELKQVYVLDNSYNYNYWAKALGEYLEGNVSPCRTTGERSSFEVWAQENPGIWGNENGAYVFSSACSFGRNPGDRLTHDEIIIYLRGVYERWIKFENKSNEFQ